MQGVPNAVASDTIRSQLGDLKKAAISLFASEEPRRFVILESIDIDGLDQGV